MAKKPKGSSDYDIGWGKPPKHTQFQKDQSGNPSGKSKKEASIKAKLLKIASEDNTVQKNGKSQAMTHLDAMAFTVFSKALKGDLRAVKFIAEQIGGDVSETSPPQQLQLTSADLEAMSSHSDWLKLLEDARSEHDLEQPTEDDDDVTDTPSCGRPASLPRRSHELRPPCLSRAARRRAFARGALHAGHLSPA
jgi:hypothetical protein